MAGGYYEVAISFALPACAVTNEAAISWGSRVLLLDNNQPVLSPNLSFAAMWSELTLRNFL